jgi:hypothetical protein
MILRIPFILEAFFIFLRFLLPAAVWPSFRFAGL